MDYCIVNADGIIENIIVADESFSAEIGALPGYEGAAIGEAYAPPEPEPEPAPEPEPTADERISALEAENHLLNQQVAALTDQNDFQEELIVELANVVYA